MSLIGLPTELRFQIYTLVAVPGVAPLQDYIGLYLSCKKIKAEFDQEGARAFIAHLNAIANADQRVKVSYTPSLTNYDASLGSSLHLHLQMHLELNLKKSRDVKCKTMRGTMTDIFALRLRFLTISVDRTIAEEPTYTDWNAPLLLIRIFKELDIKVQAHRVELRLPAMNREFAKSLRRFSLDLVYQGWSLSCTADEVDDSRDISTLLWVRN